VSLSNYVQKILSHGEYIQRGRTQRHCIIAFSNNYWDTSTTRPVLAQYQLKTAFDMSTNTTRHHSGNEHALARWNRQK